MIDQTLLDDYNELNGASVRDDAGLGIYDGCYIGHFPEKAKTATFTDSVQARGDRPCGRIAPAGRELCDSLCLRAQTYGGDSQRLSALVRFSFSEPTVTVDAPSPRGTDVYLRRVCAAQTGVVMPYQLYDPATLQTGLCRYAGDGRCLQRGQPGGLSAAPLLPVTRSMPGRSMPRALSLVYGITLDASRSIPTMCICFP